MKQIQKTPEITAALRQSVGKDVNLDELAVYEAIALNNRPIRKQHPLFNGAIADRSLLLEMAGALSQESRPVQIQHMDGELPYGRAFHGKVIDKGAETELRVLFFVNSKEEKIINKLDSGTVDQVSVSILPKHIYNSVSGFDYLGANAKADNIWTGDDGDGNILGKNGVYGRMVGMDKWLELSLVGMGGADGARIVSRDQSYFGSSYEKLAASGVDPSVFLLEASTENEDMDLKELVDKLTSTTADLTNRTNDVTSLTAQLSAATAERDALKLQLEAAAKPSEALTAAQTELTTTKTALDASNKDRDDAVAALSVVAKTLLTAAGKVDAELPKTVAELSKLIDETKTSLAATLVAGGKAEDAVDDKDKKKPVLPLSDAYRSPRR